LVTVAMEVLLLVQVPPVPGVTVVVCPAHTSLSPPRIGTVGAALMTTFSEEGEGHPSLLVTVKV
jgi:hypothetical protein